MRSWSCISAGRRAGPARGIFANPQHPYTRALLASSPSPIPPAQAHRAQGRTALAAGAAARLHLQSALPVGLRALPREVPKLQFYPGSSHMHACHAVEERRLPDLPCRRAPLRPCTRHRDRPRCRCAAKVRAVMSAGSDQMRRSTGVTGRSNERARRGGRDRRRASPRGAAAARRAPTAAPAASAPGKPCCGRLMARQSGRAPATAWSGRAS